MRVKVGCGCQNKKKFQIWFAQLCTANLERSWSSPLSTPFRFKTARIFPNEQPPKWVSFPRSHKILKLRESRKKTISNNLNSENRKKRVWKRTNESEQWRALFPKSVRLQDTYVSAKRRLCTRMRKNEYSFIILCLFTVQVSFSCKNFSDSVIWRIHSGAQIWKEIFKCWWARTVLSEVFVYYFQNGLDRFLKLEESQSRMLKCAVDLFAEGGHQVASFVVRLLVDSSADESCGLKRGWLKITLLLSLITGAIGRLHLVQVKHSMW